MGGEDRCARINGDAAETFAVVVKDELFGCLVYETEGAWERGAERGVSI